MKNYKIIHFWLEGVGGARDIKNALLQGYGMGSESSLETVRVNGARISSKL